MSPVAKSWTTSKPEGLILAALASVMFVTRLHSIGESVHLRDASLALFFLGGFYLRGPAFFAILAAEAFTIDLASINFVGVNDWCITQAYAFLGLAYLVLWNAGNFCRRFHDVTPASLARLALFAALATSIAFLISDGAFYWISGRIADPSWNGYWSHMTLYFDRYVPVAWAYLAGAALIHAAVVTAFSRRTA